MSEQNTEQIERHDLVEEGAQYRMDGIHCGRCDRHEDDPVHDPEVKVTHVVVGQSKASYGGRFGTSSVDEQGALTQFTRAGGSTAKPYMVAEFPDGVTFLGIDGMGSVRYRLDSEPGPDRPMPIWTEYERKGKVKPDGR